MLLFCLEINLDSVEDHVMTIIEAGGFRYQVILFDEK